MKKSLHLAPVLAGLLVLAGACRPSQTLESQTKDTGIKATIKTRLAAEVGATTITAVEVNVTNGAVTLAGPIGTAEDRQRVEDVARSVEGVVSVMNNLQIMSTSVTTPALMGTPMTGGAVPMTTPGIGIAEPGSPPGGYVATESATDYTPPAGAPPAETTRFPTMTTPQRTPAP